LNYFN